MHTFSPSTWEAEPVSVSSRLDWFTIINCRPEVHGKTCLKKSERKETGYLKPGVEEYIHNSSTWHESQDQGFKVSTHYLVNSRPAWIQETLSLLLLLLTIIMMMII